MNISLFATVYLLLGAGLSLWLYYHIQNSPGVYDALVYRPDKERIREVRKNFADDYDKLEDAHLVISKADYVREGVLEWQTRLDKINKALVIIVCTLLVVFWPVVLVYAVADSNSKGD